MNTVESYAQRTAKGEVTFTRLLPGPMDRVWKFLTDSEKRGLWLASGPMAECTGGKVDLHFRHGELSEEKTPPPSYSHLAGGTHLTGTVTHCKEPGLLGFTWEAGNARSEVIFRLSTFDRRVRLLLTHRRLSSPEAERNVAGGWHLHLDLLLANREGDSPPPYWTGLVKLKGEYARLFAEGSPSRAGVKLRSGSRDL